MLSLNDFEGALRKAQTSMDNISKDILKRRHFAEKQIEKLRSEMEESLFFHELDDSDEIDVESFEEEPKYSLASFESTVAALAKADETNKKLKKEIQMSEKRSKIDQQRLELSELKEKDLQYRTISLEQMMTLYQQRVSALELENAQMDRENRETREDLDRTNKKLLDTMNIVNESINHVESLEAKLEEKEISLKLTQQLFSNASDDAKTAKIAAKALRSSLAAAETKLTVAEANHEDRMNALRNDLLQAEREKNSLNESMKSIESAAAQRIKDLTAIVTDMETTNTQAVSKLEDNLKSSKYEIELLEQSLNSERNQLLVSQELTQKLEEEGAALRQELTSCGDKLKYCHQTIEEKDTDICELKKMLAYNDDELNNISAMFEEYKSMNEENIMRSLNKQDAEIEAKEQQLQELQSELEKYTGFFKNVEKAQKEQTLEIKMAQDSLQSRDAKLASLMQQLQEARKILEQKETHLNRFADNFAHLNQSAQELATTVISLQKKTSQQEIELLSLQAEKENLKKAQVQQEEHFHELVSKKEVLENELMTAKTALENAINEKEECFQQHICQKEILERELLSTKALLERETCEKENLNQQLVLRKEELEKIVPSASSRLEEELLMKESLIQQLALQKEGLEEDLLAVKSMLEVAQNELHSKGVTMDNMHVALTDNFSTISNLRADLERARLQLSLAESSIEKVKAEITMGYFLDVDPRISTLQSSLDEARALLLRKEQHIMLLQEQLRGVRIDEELLKNKSYLWDYRDLRTTVVSTSRDEQLSVSPSTLHYDIFSLKNEMVVTNQLLVSLISDRIVVEESMEALRHALEAKVLVVTKYQDLQRSSEGDVAQVKKQDYVFIENLIVISQDDARGAILRSTLVETVSWLAERNLQIAELDKEIRSASERLYFLKFEALRREEQEVTFARQSPESKETSPSRIILDVATEDKEQLAFLESKIGSAEKLVIELQAMVDAANSENEANKAYIEDLQVSLSAATRLNEEFWEQRVAVLKSKVEAAENVARERQHIIEELNGSVSKIEEEKKSAELLVQASKKSLIEMEKRYSDKLADEVLQHSQTKEELFRLSTAREKSSLFANREIEQLKKQLSDTEGNRDNMKKAVEAMIMRYSHLENNLSSVEENLTAKSKELLGWKETAERVIAEKEDLEKYLDFIKSKLDGVAHLFPKNDNKSMERLDMLHQRVDHVLKALHKKEKEAKKLSALLEQNRNYVSDLNASVDANKDTIQTLKKSIRDKEKEMKYLNESLVYVQKQIKSSTIKYDTCKQSLDEYKVHAQELHEENIDLYNKLSFLESKGIKVDSARTPNRRVGLKQSFHEKSQQSTLPKTPSRRSESLQEFLPKAPINDRSDKTKDFTSEITKEIAPTTSRHSRNLAPPPPPPEASELVSSPTSQARKNWEALKKEKAGDIFSTNKENRPNTKMLLDDEFAPTRRKNISYAVVSLNST